MAPPVNDRKGGRVEDCNPVIAPSDRSEIEKLGLSLSSAELRRTNA
jgi:hypothetical protein